MNEQIVIIAVALAAMVVIGLGVLALVKAFFVRVKPNEALVVTTTQGRRVLLTGGIVFPIVQSAEPIDLSLKTLRIERRGPNALVTHDEQRVDVDVVVTLRVNTNVEDMLKAAERIGCAKTYDPKAIEDLFSPSFTSAILGVVRHFTAKELERDRSDVEAKILQVIGTDLEGYVIDTLSLGRIEPASVESAGPFR